MTRHSLVSCSPTRRATALTRRMLKPGCMTNASEQQGEAAVRPRPGHAERLDPAAGADAHAAHRRGGQKCLVLERESEMPRLVCSVYVCQGSPPRRSSGKQTGWPAAKSMWDVRLTRSASNSLRMTAPWRSRPQRQLQQAGVAHGHFLPHSRRACLSLAPCSPPSRTLRAASRWPAAILDRSCAQRLRELRPGRENGSQPNRETPDQPRDWLSLPTPNSEEAYR